MSSFLGVRKFVLVVEDCGRMFDFSPSDDDTMDWLIENQVAVGDILSEMGYKYVSQKSDKLLALTAAAEFQNQLRYAFPYERFEVKASEYKEQVVVFGFVEYK